MKHGFGEIRGQNRMLTLERFPVSTCLKKMFLF